MQAIFIYNQYSTPEVNMIERVKEELGCYLSSLSVAEVTEVKEKYPIRATPALIVIRDDLQGEQLFNEGVDGQLLLTAMMYKQLEEEETVIHSVQSNRLDIFVNGEKAKAEDALIADMLGRGVI